MNESLLAETIFRRKSVRSYLPKPLPEETLADVLSVAEGCRRLFPEIPTAFRILSREDIRCVCPLSAPHYLAFYAERGTDSDLNCGFMLQQVNLYLSSRDIGSCWLGMAKPVEKTYRNLPLAVFLSFGLPDEDVHRTSRDQFRRKPVSEISVPGAVPDYIESMRVAPSAMNKQPWFFSGDSRNCHAFSVSGSRIFNITDTWRFMDIGIAFAHLYLASTARGKTVSFHREDSIPSGNGNEYVLSCRISDGPVS